MRNFFKKLFGWLFFKKNRYIKSELQKVTPKNIPAPAPVKSKRIFSTYKPGQKNNRLHIEYNGRGRDGQNCHWKETFYLRVRNGLDSTFKRKLWVTAGSTYNGRIDSMRCTKLQRAMEIVNQIESYCIKRATFKDYRGVEIDILKALKGEIDYAR